MIYEFTDYRQYLRSLLAERVRKNPYYSLRAFGRDLGVTASQLSDTMNGKANVSQRAARRVALRLGLSQSETDYFTNLVQLGSESHPEVRARLIDQVNLRRAGRKPVRDLNVDLFYQMADWYHCAILELVNLSGPSLTPQLAAQRLGISELEARVAIERLERLELISPDGTGGWTRTDQNLKFTSPTKSAALRTFYRQMFTKISESFEVQEPFKERLSGFETLPFSRESLPELNEAMEEFFEKASRIAKKHKRKTDVYHLGIHFINLTSHAPAIPALPAAAKSLLKKTPKGNA